MSSSFYYGILFLVLVCYDGCLSVYPPGEPTNQNNGAPQGLSPGWSPGPSQGVSAVDKQGTDTYLQALQSLQDQFKLLMQASNSEVSQAPPKPRPPPLILSPAKPDLAPKPAPQFAPPPNDNVLDLNVPNMPVMPSAPVPNPMAPMLPPQPMPQPAHQQPAWPPHGMMRPQSRECSGGYVPSQLCCDGIVNLLPPGTTQQWACCHKGLYDMTTQVCCGDVPVPRPPLNSPPMMCCGMSLYDPATHLCCDKFPVPNLSRNMKCCRKHAYDPVHQMCCGEGVKPRPPGQPHTDCCGKHTYSPLTHVCCDEGNTFLKDPMYGCCGKNQFQPAFQQCCFGDALPKGAACMAK